MARAAKKSKRAAKKSNKKSGKTSVKKVVRKAVKKATKKAAKKPGKKSAKKSIKKSAGKPLKSGKSVKGKAPPRSKTSAKKSAAKKSAAKKSIAKKSVAKKSTARKAATKKSVSKIIGRTSARVAPHGSKGTTPLAVRLNAPPPAGRKALTVSNQRKTARSRLGERAAAHEPVATRKMALRTPVAAQVVLRPGMSAAAPRSDTFDARKLEVRSAQGSDHAAIRHLLEQVFGRPAEARLVEALRASDEAQVECVAVYDGVLAGYVMLSHLPGRAGDRDIAASALAPLAVASKFTGLGIGTRLVASALPLARSAGSMAAFVLGAPDFYVRFGFSAQVAARFASPYAGPSFLVLEFEPAALHCENGEVIYPQAFAFHG